ncbi:LysR family transcriptional regulator [Ramlibacter alkalitolerans]|uniref:LysR family transcriptional regulator n=1 Tax=Ramlibacter alkalitolerans TaxID=2039631 RepID=A0ABS1JJ90_9BURK|nr:LysR family transcriptional regulator [Ramlibacter alkalitolerans]MBL0424293.1 LysR family transcriptional regulator [Ramlibacter alkalitolerans]
MDRLQSMRVFQQVVDEGGFAAAARKLDLTPAAVTRLVSDLERHLGVRLLQRTTRRLALTPAGEVYLGRLRSILSDIDEADEVAHAHSREMSGTVRVLALPVVATHIIAPAIAEFQRLYPQIVLELHVHDAVDPNVEDYDLTVLNGLFPVPSSAIVRTIVESQAVLCAAPPYLERFGEPASPEEDLRAHRWLRLRAPGTRLRSMTLIDPTRQDRTLEIEVPVVVHANHTDTLLRATVHGAGISSQPMDLVAPLLKSGHLKRVLAPWITNRLSLIVALPTRKYMPARTRAFLDHLVEHTRHTLSGLGMPEPPTL